jgi:hypothetical protein
MVKQIVYHGYIISIVPINRQVWVTVLGTAIFRQKAHVRFEKRLIDQAKDIIDLHLLGLIDPVTKVRNVAKKAVRPMRMDNSRPKQIRSSKQVDRQSRSTRVRTSIGKPIKFFSGGKVSPK